VALALLEAGRRGDAVARDPDRARESWAGILGAALWRGDRRAKARRLARATTVVNATPLDGEPSPLDLDAWPRARW